MTKKKPQVPEPAPADGNILGRAMLVNVRMGVWEARKHDQKVTTRVTERYRADPDAGRWHKHLFGGHVAELSAVSTAAHNLRITHYHQTLPWSDAGWRLLPMDNYFQYTDAVRAALTRFNEAVDDFVKAYPRLAAAAPQRLHGMYREADYPAPTAVRDKFHATVEYMPVPAAGDFRVDLPAEALAQMEEDVTARVHTAVQTAMAEAWERLGTVIYDLRTRLGDGKTLRNTIVARVRDMAEALGRLNLTNDPRLEAVRQQALTDLASLNPEIVRADDVARAAAAQKADAILKSMAQFYTPPKGA